MIGWFNQLTGNGFLCKETTSQQIIGNLFKVSKGKQFKKENMCDGNRDAFPIHLIRSILSRLRVMAFACLEIYCSRKLLSIIVRLYFYALSQCVNWLLSIFEHLISNCAHAHTSRKLVICHRHCQVMPKISLNVENKRHVKYFTINANTN